MAVLNMVAAGSIGKVPINLTLTPPTKTTYKRGEELDLTGCEVIVTYSDESTEEVTNDCTFRPANGASLVETDTQITANWIWEEIGIAYTASTPITVSRVLESIAVTTPQTKVEYYTNEMLDLTGIVVTATFTSGMTEDVTSDCTFNPPNGTMLPEPGDVDITASYTEGDVTKTATQTVNVTVKIVTWAGGTEQEIADMVAAADAGVITLSDYWAVGNERAVSLAAIPATGVGESHAAQTAVLVLMHQGGAGIKLADGVTEPKFIVGLKHSLNESGYMNSSNVTTNGWDGSARRSWCNNVFKNSIPVTLLPIFKNFKWKQGQGGGSSSGLVETVDTFALHPEKQIFGSVSGSFADEAALYSQLTWYATSANRIKKLGNSGSARDWWECSPASGGSGYFCRVDSGGNADGDGASNTYGLAPFGCI